MIDLRVLTHTFIIIYLIFIDCPAATLGTCIENSAQNTRISIDETYNRIEKILADGLMRNLISLEKINAFSRQVGKSNNAFALRLRLKTLYSGSPSLLSAPFIESLTQLFQLPTDVSGIKERLHQFTATFENDLKNRRAYQALTKSRYLKIKESIFESVPIRFVLHDSNNTDGTEHSVVRISPELKPHRKFAVSAVPITVEMWDDTLEVASGYEDKLMNFPAISYPSLLIFLNRLSEKHGFKPAYHSERLLKSIRPISNYQTLSLDKAISLAAISEISWRDQPERISLFNLMNSESRSVYDTEGYRLPTVVEIAMLLELNQQLPAIIPHESEQSIRRLNATLLQESVDSDFPWAISHSYSPTHGDFESDEHMATAAFPSYLNISLKERRWLSLKPREFFHRKLPTDKFVSILVVRTIDQ